MTVLVTSSDRADEADALEFELERGHSSAAAFVDELEALYQRLSRFPESAVELKHGIRRAILRRAGYNVFYQLDGQDVVVLRILNGRIDPASWPG